jgi:hypothetical protein
MHAVGRAKSGPQRGNGIAQADGMPVFHCENRRPLARRRARDETTERFLMPSPSVAKPDVSHDFRKAV